MDRKKAIKDFVQTTLGCGCPEEVFRTIEFKDNVVCGAFNIRTKINIGNRLLVYIADYEGDVAMQEIIPLLAEAGRKERDDLGFNRFRLVLAVTDADNLRQTVSDIFNSCNTDEKAHLHVINRKDVIC